MEETETNKSIAEDKTDKTYYICVECQKMYSEVVAEHNDYKCSACDGDLAERGTISNEE